MIKSPCNGCVQEHMPKDVCIDKCKALNDAQQASINHNEPTPTTRENITKTEHSILS